MRKYSLDKQWKFHNGDIPMPFINTHSQTYMAAKAGGRIGAASSDYDKTTWETVDIPHDFAVANEFEEKWGPSVGYKKRGKAYYSKRFRLSEEDKDKQILIEFEGVTGECIVYLNGSVIGRNFSGYNSFTVDGTDMALYGDNINDLVVFVDASMAEGWWYEGAGIYRHVNLYIKNRTHFEHNGIFLEPVKKDVAVWEVYAHVSVENISTDDCDCEIEIKLYDNDENVIGSCRSNVNVFSFDISKCEMSFLVYSPRLWDIDEPNLYRAKAVLKVNGEEIDSEEFNIGFRTIAIDAQKGFFLNGRKVKLLGTCNHQDHAGVGVAVADDVVDYRIRLLKEMGSNAYRAAHGMASKSVIDACDKYGMLVMDENRQFNTAETDGLKQVRELVMRDRNHPSVIMYSLYNEEPAQGTYTGRKLAQRLRAEAEKYDGTRFTVGANNDGLLSIDGAYDVCDFTGINYQTHMYDEFHKKFPHIPVTGSENCSALMTRGCYKTDYSKNVIDMFDSEAVPWGDTYRDAWKLINERENIAGYFVWTGFDYRGEPTPFVYPSISTQFGIMDTCGFKKSAYYLNKSYWSNEPLVHIVSHWNYNEGENVKLHIFSNCKELDILINDRLVGTVTVDDENYAEFDTVFEAGKLTVRSQDNTAEDTVYTCSETAALEIVAGAEVAHTDDAICVNVKALDKDGHFVFNAEDTVHFEVTGGTVIGVGNGNPNSHEADKADFRKLYAGYAQAIVAPNGNASQMTVTASTFDGISASVVIPVETKRNVPIQIPSVTEHYITKWRRTLELLEEYPDYSVQISDNDMNTWVVVSVGNGCDDLFDGKTGFAMYKTTAHIEQDEYLIFRELRGERVDVYINNELIFNGNTENAKNIVYQPENSGDYSITIVLYSSFDESWAGVSKPVVITK